MGHAKSKPMTGGEYKNFEKEFMIRLQSMAISILEHKDCLSGKIPLADMVLLEQLRAFTRAIDFEIDIKNHFHPVIYAEDKPKPVVEESAKASPKFSLRQPVIYHNYKRGIGPFYATVDKIISNGSRPYSYDVIFNESGKTKKQEVLESSLIAR